MTPLGETAPPPTKEQLFAQLEPSVTRIVREDVAADIEPEKLYQLRQAQKSDLYWRALQYTVPKMSDGIATFSVVGTPLAGDSINREGSGLYDYVQNIYRGYGRKFIAVLGQRAPNVKAVPDDPGDEDSEKSCRMADIAASILHAKWKTDERNLELALHLWKNGTTFAYTPYVTNGQRYGYSEEPKLQARTVAMGPSKFRCIQCGAELARDQADPNAPVCPQCQRPFGPEDLHPPETIEVPEPAGVTRYENGSVEFYLCTLMTVTVPFFTRDLEDASHLTYEYEEYQAKLKAAHPKLRQMNLGGSGGVDSSASGIGTIVRDTAASPIGVPNPRRESRWNYKRIWLKTEMYEGEKDDQLRQALYTNFPDGLKVTVVEGQVIDFQNEKLTDVWAACKPETSEYIFADAIGYDMLPVQDLKNDALNLAYETLERGISVTFADPRVIDIDEWNKKQALPAEIIPALGAVGDSLSASFHQTEPTRFSDQLMPWQAGVEQDGRTGVGVTDPIFAGGDPTPTARQDELRKNAALMQLGTTWLYMRKFWESATTNGVKQLARYGAGMLHSVRKGAEGYESLVLDLAELREDGWHFESEEAIPMSWGQQRDLLMFMMEKPPQVLQQFGYLHPRNIPKNQSLLGMAGYYQPGLDDDEKAHEIISQLIKAKPIQQPGPDGQIDLQPSIPIDDFDNHAGMAEEARAWLVSRIGRQLRQSNQDGYMNVVAWWKKHSQAANAPPPPPSPPPPKLSLSSKLSDPVTPQGQQILNQFGIQTAPPQPPQAAAVTAPMGAPPPGVPAAPAAPAGTAAPPAGPIPPPAGSGPGLNAPQ